MYQTIIFPDFDKLDYLLPYQKKYIDDEKSKGSLLEIEDMDKGGFQRIYEGLKLILEKEQFNLANHFNEILFVSFTAFERRLDQIMYEFDEYFLETGAIELAKVLLAYLEFVKYKNDMWAKDVTLTKPFSILIKFHGYDVETTNKYFTEWILEQVYKTLESGGSPHHAPLTKGLFSKTFGGEMDIDVIRKIADTKVKKPIGKVKKREVFNFSKKLQEYLDLKTHLKTPDGKLLGNLQAKLFYEILELFGMIQHEKLNSPPEDYMHLQYSRFS